jgi:trk system potassium uptake protein TrkA
VGCGKVGLQLLRFLRTERHYLVAIDKDQTALDELGPDFPGLTLRGNGIDTELLERAGIKKADALAAVTGDDNTNLVAAQIAKTKYGVPRVLARLFDLDSRKPFAELGIRALSPAVSGAIDIRNYIEEVDFHRDSLLYSLEIDLVRLRIKAHLRGTSLTEVQKKANLRIIALIRDHEAILPVDDESLEEDDILVAAVHQDVVKDLRQYFRLEG